MTDDAEETSLLLAIETSGDVCSVAVLRGGAFSSEHTFRHGMHLSERLIDHIDAVLAEAGATLEDVSTFAAGVGPGSFTGTRIGVMTAKTLAAVCSKPIVAINSLEALAFDYSGVTETIVVPVAACREGYVYACPYALAEGGPQSLADMAADTIADLAAVLIQLEPRSVLLCGPASERLFPMVRSALLHTAISVGFGRFLYPRASTVGQLAALRLQIDPAGDDVLALVPAYISPPPITMPRPVNAALPQSTA